MSKIKKDLDAGSSPSLDDVATTLEATEAVGGNFLGVKSYDGTFGEECDIDGDGEIDNWDAGYHHCYAREFAEKKSENMFVFGYAREKHQSTTSRWLAEDPDFTEDDTYTPDNLARWVAAWKAAMQEQSQYGLDAFSPDDFSPHICHPGFSVSHDRYDACYTKEHIADFIAAGRDCEGCNTDFEFLPIMYYDHLPRFLYPGYVLGADYGTKMFIGHDESRLSFDLYVNERPSSATLSYFYYHDNEDADTNIDNMYLTITVNGTEVYSEAVMNGDHFVEKQEIDITDELCVVGDLGCEEFGDNEILMRLYPHPDEGNLNTSHYKTLYISNLAVTLDDERVEDFSPTLEADHSEISYTYGSETITSNEGRIFATSNEDYLIKDALEKGGGAMVFISNDDLEGTSNEDFDELMEFTKKSFGEAKFIAAFYASLWGTESDQEKVVEKIEIARKHADGVVLWGFPLAHYKYTGGIFAETESNSSSYDHVLMFPNYQTGHQGWYKSLSTTTKVTGKIKVRILDNGDADDVDGEFFTIEILNEDDDVYWSKLYGFNDGVEKSFVLDLGTNKKKLKFRLTETANVSTVGAKTYFSVLNKGAWDFKDVDGNLVEWEFDSGTTEDFIIDMYCGIRNNFLTALGKEVSDTIKFDPDGDGVENCLQ